MRTIESVVGRELHWVQPSIFKRVFELRNMSTLVARVTFPRFLSEEALAESADGCWNFSRKGIWNTTIFVSTCDDETPIVSIESRRWGKNYPIQLPGGEKMTMTTDFWGWKFILQTETGELIAEVKRKGLFSGTYKLDLRRRGSTYQELPWLVLLLWYVMVLEQRRRRSSAG